MVIDQLYTSREVLRPSSMADMVDEFVIVLIENEEVLESFVEVIESVHSIVFDMEGVNLSRAGEATLVTIGIDTGEIKSIYIFDLLNSALKDRFISTIKELAESERFEKIIHDCRQDADALKYQFDISLDNVFDTSVYDAELRGDVSRSKLNDVLIRYGCNPNSTRSPIRYTIDENYWFTRPLRKEMINSAAKDVTGLFLLKDHLLLALDKKGLSAEEKDYISGLSSNAPSEYSSLHEFELVSVPTSKKGLVIGTNGLNIMMIEGEHNVVISSYIVKDEKYLVLGESKESINKAKEAMNDLVSPINHCIRLLNGPVIVDFKIRRKLWNDLSKIITHANWYTEEERNKIKTVASKSRNLTAKQRITATTLKPHIHYDNEYDNEYDDDDEYGYGKNFFFSHNS